MILAGVTFAAAFAAPFFVLALFPSLLKTLPRSGGWLDTVKVVMGFLELAAAFKFFRTAELRLADRPELLHLRPGAGRRGWPSRSPAGLYLLNVYRLPHDEETAAVGVGRLLLGLGFLGLAVYLAPALFKPRPPGRPAPGRAGWCTPGWMRSCSRTRPSGATSCRGGPTCRPPWPGSPGTATGGGEAAVSWTSPG